MKQLIKNFKDFVNEELSSNLGDESISGKYDKQDYQTTLADEMENFTGSNQPDLTKGSNEIARALDADPRDIISLGSPSNIEDLTNPIFDLVTVQHGQTGTKVLNKELQWEKFYESGEDSIPGEYGVYYVADVKGIRVVAIEADDGPFIYLKKEDFDKL